MKYVLVEKLNPGLTFVRAERVRWSRNYTTKSVRYALKFASRQDARNFKGLKGFRDFHVYYQIVSLEEALVLETMAK